MLQLPENLALSVVIWIIAVLNKKQSPCNLYKIRVEIAPLGIQGMALQEKIESFGNISLDGMQMIQVHQGEALSAGGDKIPVYDDRDGSL